MNLSELNELDFNNAGSWPAPVKAVFAILIVALVAGAGYYLDTSGLLQELDNARATERQLREEYAQKRRVTANLETYQAQIEELQTLLDTMLKQLPTHTEMPDLLEDISNIGRTNGLAFELFRPENERPRDFYAAKPIAIRARADYHQFSAFISSIAALPRIVTLENMSIESPGGPGKKVEDNRLRIQATLQTYRYLEEDGDEANKKTTGKGAKKT